jgi:hypothetical protein
VLVIDKNVENLTRIADRHYIIERGRAVWSGTSEELIGEPELQHRYLGIQAQVRPFVATRRPRTFASHADLLDGYSALVLGIDPRSPRKKLNDAFLAAALPNHSPFPPAVGDVALPSLRMEYVLCRPAHK